MITIREEILINSEIQKVWSFLSDLETSLSVNKFHQQIIIPNGFSLTNTSHKFNIIHNFGLGNINMVVQITNYSPLKTMCLFKKNKEKLHKAFEHTSQYELSGDNSTTKLIYSVSGSFNFKIQNIPFKPILIKVMQNELSNIKNMIESSEKLPSEIETKITAT